MARPSHAVSEAIVLKVQPYSETSLIATVFARERGKLRVLAKGARRTSSAFAGKLEPTAKVEVVTLGGRSGLRTLTDCSLIDARLGLRSEYRRLHGALAMLALVDATQPEEDRNVEVYALLDAALHALGRGTRPGVLSFGFLASLLEASGYAIRFDACAGCGKPLRRASGFSASRHGFVCAACARGLAPVRVSPAVYGSARLLFETARSAGRRLPDLRLTKPQTRALGRFFTVVFRTTFERPFDLSPLVELATPP